MYLSELKPLFLRKTPTKMNISDKNPLLSSFFFRQLFIFLKKPTGFLPLLVLLSSCYYKH